MVLIIKKTPLYMVCSLYGGQGWIRTNEDVVDGFTVRCIWPLCNLPINLKHFYGAFWSWWKESNLQPADYKSAALPLSHTSIRFKWFFVYIMGVIVEWLKMGDVIPQTTSGALRWNRTTDTRIFSPLLYRLSYQGMIKKEGTFNHFLLKKGYGDSNGARTHDLQRDRLAF